MTFNFRRSTELYVSTTKDPLAQTEDNTFKINVLEGFSFDQESGSENIGINEAGDAPIRGQKVFNTSLQPATFSLPIYVRPFYDDSGGEGSEFHSCIEKPLWEALAGAGPIDTNAVEGENSFDVSFANSDVHELLKLYLYFKVDGKTYLIERAVINTAEIDFSIDGIATITWSGEGVAIEDAAAPTVYRDIPAEAEFIKNKLSTMTLVNNEDSKSYDVAITGGSITFSNNFEFLIPEELGIVNKPIGGFTGTRSVEGNVTCYLNTGATKSGELFSDLVEDSDTVTQDFSLQLNMGGPSTPRVEFAMPHAHLLIPTIQTEDVFSLSVDFVGLGSAIDQADEMSVSYIATDGA